MTNLLDLDNKILELLQNDPDLQTVNDRNVLIEIDGNLDPNAEQCPYIGIFRTGYEIPEEEEIIGGIARVYYIYEIWCFEHSVDDNLSKQFRDNLFQKLRLVLHKNRKLKYPEVALRTLFKPGEFSTIQTGDVFLRGASIILYVEVRE